MYPLIQHGVDAILSIQVGCTNNIELGNIKVEESRYDIAGCILLLCTECSTKEKYGVP